TYLLSFLLYCHPAHPALPSFLTRRSAGSGMNQFDGPFGVSVSAGQIYVADRNNNRIVRMNDMTGVGWTEFGTFGNGPNQFSSPFGIFVSAGQIFVVDTFNSRIVRMD